MVKRSSIPVKKRSAYKNLLTTRREYVATLRNRLLTEREIEREMADSDSAFYLVNPRNDKPYSDTTIHNDLVFLKQQAIENSKKEFEEYRAYHLAEIREARKVAWARGDLEKIHRFLRLEMELLGTLNGSITLNQNNFMLNNGDEPVDVEDLTDEMLVQIAAQALRDDFEVVEGKLVTKTEDVDHE